MLPASDWDEFLSHYPDAHLLQTSAWGVLKSGFGWDVARVTAGETGAQILFRRLPLGFNLAYIPKGPVGNCWENLWPVVDTVCRERKSVFLKVEPDLWESPAGSSLVPGCPDTPAGPPPGFNHSLQCVQPPRTLVIDLTGEEERVLSRMRQKTRYNIRLALKKGVVVRSSADLGTFQRLMHVTGRRDSFGVHSLDYYQQAYELFHPRGQCELLVAEYGGEPLAGLMVFARGHRAWYFYGASADDHRERMPTYLLQWEAMRWARAQGCMEYDLWGVPDVEEEVLEESFTGRSDGLWGVYRFKRGFGGELRRSLGPWDRVYLPVLYAFYRWWTNRRALV